jgi:hypothetical protein
MFKSILPSIASFAVASALPVYEDLHDTKVAVTPVKYAGSIPDPAASTVVLTIERKDLLVNVDNDKMKTVAERIHRIETSFDVVGGEILCNGEFLEPGISHLQTKMITLVVKTDESETKDAKELAKEFEKGIAKVEMEVAISELMMDGQAFRRVIIHERILE